MKKSDKNPSLMKASPTAGAVTVQMPLALLEALEDSRSAFFGLCVEAGRSVLEAMMEADRTATRGPKGRHDTAREAIRGGTTLPGWVRESSASKSAVSRRFVALTEKRMRKWMTRPLDELDLRVVMIDGKVFRKHCLLIALGPDSEGRKHVLGLREGTTENAAVAKALLADLIARGLPTDRAMLFAVDGARALRKAIADTYGELGLVQRCQEHKRRNVLDHLPDHMHGHVGRALAQAWQAGSVSVAKRQLEHLATSLDNEHPGAAASVREGLDETLTLIGLGIDGALYQTLIRSRTSTDRSLATRAT